MQTYILELPIDCGIYHIAAASTAVQTIFPELRRKRAVIMARDRANYRVNYVQKFQGRHRKSNIITRIIAAIRALRQLWSLPSARLSHKKLALARATVAITARINLKKMKLHPARPLQVAVCFPS